MQRDTFDICESVGLEKLCIGFFKNWFVKENPFLNKHAESLVELKYSSEIWRNKNRNIK